MTTYLYETIPSKAGTKPSHFEIKQRMSDAPLTRHPETGEPVRRVMLGGFGVMSGAKDNNRGDSEPAAGGGSCCGGGCGCH